MGTLLDLAPGLNFRAQVAHAERVIDIALENSRRPLCSTKFSALSAVFLHLVASRKPDLPVVWVDTGYNTRATTAFANSLSERLGLALHVYRPLDHEIRLPPALDAPDHAAFVRAVKLEPFSRALKHFGADLWLSSLRRYQSPHRRTLDSFEVRDGPIVKALPMLEWSAESVERYRRMHDLPRGPEAYDPTKGEPFRECGLHTTL